MRFLLVCILALLPLTAQAENIDNLSANELRPGSVIDPFGERSLDDLDSLLTEWPPYANPYGPSSATNFEAIPALSLYNPARPSPNLYEPDWLSNPFGHYGDPYSPNQFNDR